MATPVKSIVKTPNYGFSPPPKTKHFLPVLNGDCISSNLADNERLAYDLKNLYKASGKISIITGKVTN